MVQASGSVFSVCVVACRMSEVLVGEVGVGMVSNVIGGRAPAGHHRRGLGETAGGGRAPAGHQRTKTVGCLEPESKTVPAILGRRPLHDEDGSSLEAVVTKQGPAPRAPRGALRSTSRYRKGTLPRTTPPAGANPLVSKGPAGQFIAAAEAAAINVCVVFVGELHVQTERAAPASLRTR